MSPELQAMSVVSGWKPITRAPLGSESTEHHVLDLWAEQLGNCGIGIDDLHNGIEWQEIDSETMAYRIDERLLLVVTWDYDGAPDGSGWSVLEWQMGTEVSQ